VGSLKVAVIGGDGIGPEVVDEALKVVEAAGVALETRRFDLGADHFLATGEVLDDGTLSELKACDAILLGAVGAPPGSSAVPPGLLERGLLLRLRFELDLYINLRPFYGYRGSVAEGAEFVVVRENTEGAYAGEGGFLRKGSAHEVALQGSVNTRFGVERTIRYAFSLAEGRRKKLTLVHKTNVLTFAGDLWQRAFQDVASEYPEVAVDYHHVDAACIYLVEDPHRYDVVVTDNLFGDILTDLAGAVCGGIGLAPSGNLNPEKRAPSLFEPVHGAAYDIVGTGRANPLGAIASAAMMLEFLGQNDAASRITAAVREVANETRAKGARLTTKELGELVAERVARDAD
jgi:3-isopropylmalate dehydrogenase